MTESLKARAFRAFGDWCIRRAKRTPYFHLFHEDGRPYMERYWLLRIGMPRGWRDMEREVLKLEKRLAEDPYLSTPARARVQLRIDDLRVALYPRLGIRVHRIVSSDDRVFHDHPWNFASLILRGGYNEVTPITPDGVTGFVRRYEAGSFRCMRASQWHYLTLAPGEDAWTLFITGPKRQSWGFLVDGVKVPWRQYMAQRKGAPSA